MPNHFHLLLEVGLRQGRRRSYQIGKARPHCFSLGYDNVGNITSITDNLFTASRSFGYDDLNRLVTASGTFGPNQSRQNCTFGTYDPIGNITDKCSYTCSYGDPMHPSAVTYNPATSKNYSYDANGNMITRGTQTLTWDADNRVTSISIQGGGTTYMEYDYAGVRVKKDAPTGTTLYPFSGVEIDPNGVMTKYIRATGDIDPTHRFTGKELDPETGLYYYGGRYFCLRRKPMIIFCCWISTRPITFHI